MDQLKAMRTRYNVIYVPLSAIPLSGILCPEILTVKTLPSGILFLSLVYIFL